MTDDQICALLPGVYYMNPPDGGNVTLLEQLQRMAKDAERYRWLRGEGWDRPAKMWVTRLNDGTPIVHSDLDEAIDAAMVVVAEREGR